MSSPLTNPAQTDTPLVLIVEDDAITALDLQRSLQSQRPSCMVSVASSGDEALTLAAVVGADAAVMDINLRGSLDGIETAGLLWRGHRVPSVFVTGMSPNSVANRLAGVEHAGLLTKPLDKGALADALDRALDVRHQWQAREAQGQGIMRFFVVGDEDGGIRARLEELGHEVVAGSQWEPIAEAVSKSNVPEDVLLVDLPEKSGTELALDLRALHRRCPRVPVVLSTAGAALPMPEAAWCGVHAYLRSPLDLAELELVVLRLQDRRVNESMRDRVTGLYRRAGFVALARQQLRAARRTGTQVSLLRADLANDAHDMAEIESSLGRLGAIMRSTFRDADVSGRINGTDCGVLLLNADATTTQIALSRLRAQIEEYNADADPALQLDVEVCLAHFDPERPCSFEELIAGTLSPHFPNRE